MTRYHSARSLTPSKRGNPKFDLKKTSELGQGLKFIFECRNSTMHAQPGVASATQQIHPGNFQPWTELKHERVLELAKVPVRLLAEFCAGTAPLVAEMSSDVAYQLQLREFEKASG